MSYDSLTNRGDYLSPHYLAEVLPRELAGKEGLRVRWAAEEDSPVKALRALKRGYFAARPELAAFAQRADSGDLITDDERRGYDKAVKKQNEDVLRALGFAASRGVADVARSGEVFAVPVAYHGQNVVAVDCGWAADTDAALDGDRAGRLLDRVQTGTSEWIETGAKLARWLFDTDEPPRYVLLLTGGVVILADRFQWGEGRYLAASLDIAVERGDQPELETIAALFSADVLQPPAEGGSEQLATWVDESRKHAVGVSAELREGLRESVQLIANEVLDRIRAHGTAPEDVMALGDLAKELGRESLRYLYRILFLLYAEARPELGILPVKDSDYVAGYSMQRLGELVARRLIGDEARTGFHLFESLDLLFRMVNDGHRSRGGADTEGLSEGEGLRFEALKADLFDPARTRLIGRDVRLDDEDQPLDTRLRDEVMYKVLRRLMLAKGSAGRGGAGRKGKNQRGGFISYAQLGINQLGAVYEGLMSYTGFIATEELYEVAKKGESSGGSWMIPASKVSGYADDVFVMAVDENGFRSKTERVRYRPGTFVYRLAGRDRQTSASYYTPQSLTSVTVQLALEQRQKEEGRKVTAAEVLHWRVCEPALGSGAFLNEAIDQLAALYMKLHEEETGNRLEPEQRALALQKVKAYIALHNSYGVDLNETAVELAEVSIWLNVMHQGLQAPWFGLHLVRGNSLIGAGRRLYASSDLVKGLWLKSAPSDVPFSAGPIPAGHVHHFLLPAEGWAAVAGEKEARELAPDDTKRLADWRKKLRVSPSPKRSAGHKASQVQRLQDLAGRAEYLWSLVIERLRISEREISRAIDVWGASDLPSALEAKPRDEILADLTSPGTPYWRLKTVMDAWCALWFWPVDKAALLDGSASVYAFEPAPVAPEPAVAERPAAIFPTTYVVSSLFDEDEPVQLPLAAAAPRKPRPKPVRRPVVALKDLEDWLEFAESVLGREDIPADSLVASFDRLSDLAGYEDQLHLYTGMDTWQLLGERFPWLDTVADIAEQQGFFHWELRFAQVFSAGGFDLQLGNPPWVRPQWDEDGFLAEYEPWFKLVEKAAADEKAARRAIVLGSPVPRGYLLSERAVTSGTITLLRSSQMYPLLVGTQPDTYRAFMARTWSNAGGNGTIGLVHPDTHFTGEREGLIREAAYSRLRVHADFVNPGHRFFPEPVGESSHFGVHVYGPMGEIGFDHLSWLFSVESLRGSTHHDGSGDAPSIRYKGHLDERPHRKRIVRVDRNVLSRWRGLTGAEDAVAQQVKILSPVSTDEQEAIRVLADYLPRLGDFDLRSSSGFHETAIRKTGLIKYDLSCPGDWSEVILKGIQIGLATPMFKSPVAGSNDVLGWNLTTMPAGASPQTEYRRAVDKVQYESAMDLWTGYGLGVDARRYTEFYRLAWRRQIAPDTERSLYAAIIPPGPAHVNLVESIALASNRATVLASGFFCSLPLDYFVRITGKGDLRTGGAKTLPFGTLDHPLASALLLRTMRLNCLTTAYSDLWADVYDDNWRDDAWVYSQGVPSSLAPVGPIWEYNTPLRTEWDRRAALVEIDALVAVWLGMDIGALIAMYDARFPVLKRFEESMWFDSDGCKLAGNHRTHGQIQTKEHWLQFEKYLEDPAVNPPPDGYHPPFYKADRISEYRQAHAAFTERLRQAQQ